MGIFDIHLYCVSTSTVHNNLPINWFYFINFILLAVYMRRPIMQKKQNYVIVTVHM